MMVIVNIFKVNYSFSHHGSVYEEWQSCASSKRTVCRAKSSDSQGKLHPLISWLIVIVILEVLVLVATVVHMSFLC